MVAGDGEVPHPARGLPGSVPAGDFRFIRGENLIQLYESSPGNFRGFCRICGSNAPVRWAPGNLVFVPAGLLDDDPGVQPSVHMYVGSKAPWWDITDRIMQLEEGVPGYGPMNPKP